jgi:dihydrofolate synthase/folylpolyglutamate synthase
VSGQAWTAEEAERHLLSLELFGMRFGLDRVRRVLTALDSPQEAFASIHVVGTNGKSSTARMIAAVLEAHGIRTGAYLSPHLIGFEERIRVGDADLDRPAFAAAVQRAARAAAKVDRTAAEGDRVTQFELLTAAAFSALADQDIDVAVVEAGLGGRYDATNVLSSRVQVLTNVGLEHTRWLGPTIADIAREKLAVVRDGGTLVVGDLHPDALVEAEQVARARGARLVRADLDRAEGLPVAGRYQRRNFALACTAAEADLDRLDPGAVRAAASVQVPGRLHPVDTEPLTLLDGAHNPTGIKALVTSLTELIEPGTPLVACVSILEDKDAAAMLEVLLPACAAVVFCACANPRALPPATLASVAGQLRPGGAYELVPDPRAALARARVLAGRSGLALATGSIYLVADLVRPPDRSTATSRL